MGGGSKCTEDKEEPVSLGGPGFTAAGAGHGMNSLNHGSVWAGKKEAGERNGGLTADQKGAGGCKCSNRAILEAQRSLDRTLAPPAQGPLEPGSAPPPGPGPVSQAHFRPPGPGHALVGGPRGLSSSRGNRGPPEHHWGPAGTMRLPGALARFPQHPGPVHPVPALLREVTRKLGLFMQRSV